MRTYYNSLLLYNISAAFVSFFYSIFEASQSLPGYLPPGIITTGGYIIPSLV